MNIEQRIRAKIDTVFDELVDEHKLKTGEWSPENEMQLDIGIELIAIVVREWLKNNK